MHLLQRKLLYPDWTLTEVLFLRSNWYKVSFDSANGMALSRWLTISHYLNQCWSSVLLSYDLTGDYWDKGTQVIIDFCIIILSERHQFISNILAYKQLFKKGWNKVFFHPIDLNNIIVRNSLWVFNISSSENTLFCLASWFSIDWQSYMEVG